MKNILVVDDSEMFYRLLKNAIKNAKVEWAQNGEEAIKKYLQIKPELVLLDLILPDLSGIEVIEKIKEEDKDARVVVLSGIDNYNVAEDAKRAGAVKFISKSAGIKYIIEEINRAID